MTGRLDVFPGEASTAARGVDIIFWGLTAFSAAIVLTVVTLIVVFAIRYRRGSSAKRGELPDLIGREFEIGWTVGALFLAVFIFWWAASNQLTALTPPKDAMEVHVVGKQWMWKLQHASGAREINALHVPIGRPVKLILTSQDVIHDFYVPAFRMKTDVLPGRYTQEWFQATKTGTFPIFCAEYCGTDHSRMGGEVTVMRPEDYARWTAAQPNGDDLAAQGGRLYAQLGCGSCHGGKDAPDLDGLYGSQVRLADGKLLTADESYLHDVVTAPERFPLAGWPQAMPSYAKAADEEDLVALTAYLKSLKPTGARP